MLLELGDRLGEALVLARVAGCGHRRDQEAARRTVPLIAGDETAERDADRVERA